MTLRSTYLILAIIGAVVPCLFFIDFFSEYGVALPEFIAALFVNGAAGGFSVDLLISSLVFWLFMFARRAQLASHAPSPWFYLLLNLTIGLSCALPAYLYSQAKIDKK